MMSIIPDDVRIVARTAVTITNEMVNASATPEALAAARESLDQSARWRYPAHRFQHEEIVPGKKLCQIHRTYQYSRWLHMKFRVTQFARSVFTGRNDFVVSE